MLAPNHVVGGVVVTGFFGALCGENILHTKTNIFCVLLFSLLPDIDNPKSPVSWLCRPLSIWTFRHYGHRTVTHSLAALAVVVAVTFVLGHFTPLSISAVICGFAYFSHLFLDMMTVQGVPLMYPWSRSPYVLPDNPRYRFRTGDAKTEIMIFGVFTGLLVFLMPLFEDGFWTTYNRNFGTPKTLYSEFIKSNDLLEAVYIIQKGSALETGKGFVLDADNQDKFTLLRNDSIFNFDATKQIIKSVIPSHTGKKFYIENLTFVGIGVDSLNAIVSSKNIMDIQADANEPFIVTERGIPNKTLSAKYHFPNKLFFRVLDSLPPKDELFQETDLSSLAIRNHLKTLNDEFEFRKKEFARHADSIRIYDEAAKAETNFVKKETNQRRRDALRLEETPQFDYVRKSALLAELRISEARFVIENRRRLFEREQAYNAAIRAKPRTSFVGFIKWIRIEENKVGDLLGFIDNKNTTLHPN